MAMTSVLLALSSSLVSRTAAAPGLSARNWSNFSMDIAVETAVQCPQDNGTVLNQPDGTQYRILCGFDLWDPNAENYTVTSTLQGCIDNCGSDDWSDDCWGVVWVQSGQKETYCYQKPLAAHAEAASANIQTAQRLPTCPKDNGTTYGANGLTFVVECGYEYYGHNIGYPISTDSLADCINTCAETDGCVDVSWNFGSPGPCWMKNGIGEGNYNPEIWGARATGQNPWSDKPRLTCPFNDGDTYNSTITSRQYQILCEIDISDSNLPNSPVQAPDLDHCVIACDNTTGCNAAVLAGTNCYLKGHTGPTYNNPGLNAALCISGC